MLRYNELLSTHTSLGIGGEAFCWIEAEDFSSLLEGIDFLGKDGKSLAVFGGGFNLLVKDQGFDGGIIHLSRGFDFIAEEDRDLLKVGSSMPLSRLVEESFAFGLGGCEFLYGIPGSFGGAVFMNAGVRDLDNLEQFKELSSVLLDLEVLDLKDKKKKTLLKKDIDFGYRRSNLEGYIILSGRVKLEPMEKEEIDRELERFKKSRIWLSKLDARSAGSIFKNPDSMNPAGRLIEGCGLKGKRVGGAQISSVHANFIVNRGGASSQDVLDLIEIARSSVREKFGVELKLELKIL